MLKFKDVLSHLNASAAAVDVEKFNSKLLRRSSAAFLQQGKLTYQPNPAQEISLSRKPQKTLSEKIEKKNSQSRRIKRKNCHLLCGQGIYSSEIIFQFLLFFLLFPSC